MCRFRQLVLAASLCTMVGCTSSYCCSHPWFGWLTNRGCCQPCCDPGANYGSGYETTVIGSPVLAAPPVNGGAPAPVAPAPNGAAVVPAAPSQPYAKPAPYVPNGK